MSPSLRITVAAFTAAAISSFGVVAVAPVALADTPGCVTHSEYRHVHKGMKKTRVHRIFDTIGHRDAIAHSGGYTSEIRSYKTCSPYSAVSIAYDAGPNEPLRLSAKSAVWVN
jgi:hypothetical protein